jgi:hypothetical protein
MNDVFPVLFGGFLNSLTMRVENWVANWLTPIWTLGLGALCGLLLIVALVIVGFLVSRIAPLSNALDSRNARLVAGGVLGLILLGCASPWIMHQLQLHWAVPNQGEVNRVVDALWAFIPAAIAALVTGLALATLAWRRTIEELPQLFQEGPLFWVTMATAAFALFGVFGTTVIRDPEGMLDSLVRWPSLGTQHHSFAVKGNQTGQFEKPEEQAFPLALRHKELRSIRFASNETLMVSGYSEDEKTNVQPVIVSAEQPAAWSASTDPGGIFGELDPIETIYVRNYGDRDATLEMTVTSGPAMPEMLTVPITALGILGLFLMFLALWGALPKLAAVAFATAKSEMNTPLYILLTSLGAFALFVFMWLPYNTFGEDIKMLKFASLDWMLFVALIQTIWSASSSVADEVEGRTALTVLSKPVGRRDFILGKFVGICWIVLVMFTIFAAVTLLSVAYKPIFDVKEGGKQPERPHVADPLGFAEPGQLTSISEVEVTWQMCHAEMISMIPAILLVYCETIVMAAVSVAISTRLGLVANFMICFGVYAVGHLTPLLVQSGLGKFEAVTFMGQLISAVLPVLEYFDVKAAIAKGSAVSLPYVGATMVYTALYSTVAMLLALVLFEDRDLA